MADLNYIQMAQEVKITGQDSTGTTVNYVGADSNGGLITSVLDIAPSNGTITALDTATTPFTGANSQIFYTGTPTAGSSANFALASINTVNVQSSILGTGGTLVVEISMDGGTFWFRPDIFQPGTQSYANSFALPFMGTISVVGMTNIRVRAITSWSGTATITVKESLNQRAATITDPLPDGTNTIGAVTQASGPWAQNITQIAGSALSLGQKTMASSIPVVVSSDQSALQVIGNAADGSADTGNPVKVAGTDGTNVQTLKTDTNGVLFTSDRVALTAGTATSVSVGVATTAAIASNANRKGLVLTNLSSSRISLGFGASAVLNTGITLLPGGIFVMDNYLFTTAAVNAIAGTAASVLAVQEFS